MISIKAKINIGGGEILKNDSSISPPNNFINVSAPLSAVIGETKAQLQNCFILGESLLDSGAVYVDSLPYIRGRELSDNNGDFSTPYIMKFKGSNLENTVILFDEENSAHPNFVKYRYSTDNGGTWSGLKTAYDNDARIELVFDTPANLVEVTISNWNKPNSPFIVMGIYTIGTYEINNDKLISFSSDILDRSNIQQPSYGVVSNSANLICIDFNGEIFELITKKILHSGIIVDVFLDNDTSNTEEQICAMQIQQLTYSNGNNQVNMQLKDNLEDLQDINVEAKYYTPTVSNPQKAKYFYDYLYQKTIELGNYNVMAFSELDTATQDILNNTNIVYPLLENNNLWNEWNKLCALCFLNIYIDNYNTVVVKYSGGD